MTAVKKGIIISFMIVSIFFTACVLLRRRPDREHSMADMRITAILPYDKGYWEKIQLGLLSGIEGMNADIKVCCPDTDYSITEMTSLIKQAIASRVDAIIVQGANDSAYLDALKTASENGILVAFIDTDVPQFPQRIYVGTDNYSAGKFMAEKLIELTGGHSNTVVLMGGQDFPNLTSRLEGFLDSIAEYEAIHLVAIEQTNYDIITVINKYRDINEKDNTVDALICLDGTGGAALGSGLGQLCPSSMKILCFDTMNGTKKAIQNGVVDGTIAQDPVEMGKQILSELYRNFQNRQPLPSIIYTDISFITAADLEEETDEN